jgi:uncharacterized membrane protein
MKSLEALRSELHSDSPGVDALGRSLGWFSIALGLGELAMPKLLARLAGAEPTMGAALALRVAGVREIGVGIAILMMPDRPVPLWLRVAGDALDLAMIGVASTHRKAKRGRLAGAAAAIAGIAALDAFASVRTTRAFEAAGNPVMFSVTIDKSPQEVYDFFRHFERLPMFMDFLDSVEEIDAEHINWTAKLPTGRSVSWQAEITQDRPGECIAWMTRAERFEHEGRITFARAPGRDMTEVRVEMKLGVLGRPPSALLAKLLAKPEIKGELRRLKQVLETGEVLYSDASRFRKPHPARPAAPGEKVKTTELPFIPTPPQAQKGAER